MPQSYDPGLIPKPYDLWFDTADSISIAHIVGSVVIEISCLPTPHPWIRMLSMAGTWLNWQSARSGKLPMPQQEIS